MCGGEGVVAMHRCPIKLLTENVEIGKNITRAFRFVQIFRSSQVMPIDGGAVAQSCTMMRAIEIASSEEAAIQQEEMEERRKAAEQASRK